MDIEQHFYNCQITKTVGLIKNKWIICILRDLFLGKSRFNDFLKCNKGLTKKQLSATLTKMENNQLIIKYYHHTNFTHYELTDKGKSLNKILYEIILFSIENNNNTLDNNILIDYLEENILK